MTTEYDPYKDPAYVPLQVTAVKEPEVYPALADAWEEIFGKKPAKETICILLAQWALETGRGKSCNNYNLGNVKRGKKYTGTFTMFPNTGEIIEGREYIFQPPHPQTFFKAFPTLKDGCISYISFLNNSRYKESIKFLEAGDVVGYTKAIHKAGYFTASLERYTKTMSGVFNEYVKKADKFTKPEEKVELIKEFDEKIQPILFLPIMPEKNVRDYEPPVQDKQTSLSALIEAILKLIQGLFGKR